MRRATDLFEEIMEIRGSFNARYGAMKGSLENVVTEVKEIWQKYTDEIPA